MKLVRAAGAVLALATFLVAATACRKPGVVPVTGPDKEHATFEDEQAETAISVSNFSGMTRMVVTYNDNTGNAATILYTPTTRTVKSGASLLGWSYSDNAGASWTYGGKVLPPGGWAALWGDPAITFLFSDQRFVYISNLAIPSSKMPAAGISGAVNAYLGGACIARSTDGGKTFAHCQCVTNNSHFYDGGSMTDVNGDVYSAFVDVDSDQIDVWRSKGKACEFERLSSPYPGMEMISHPRLRSDRATGSVYVAAQASNYVIYLNRWKNGQWGTPVPASWVAAIYPRIYLSDRELRTGPQFSFDVGAAGDNEGTDRIRMVYTTKHGGASDYYVRGSYCDDDLTFCGDAPEWGTTPGNFNLKGDQFNPNVRAFPGFIGLEPEWKVMYMTRQDDPAGNTVGIRQGGLLRIFGGLRFMIPSEVLSKMPVCSDLRGYWGDYNDVQFAGVHPDSTNARFLAAFTDSSMGCPERWEYRAKHMHVSSAMLP